MTLAPIRRLLSAARLAVSLVGCRHYGGRVGPVFAAEIAGLWPPSALRRTLNGWEKWLDEALRAR